MNLRLRMALAFVVLLAGAALGPAHGAKTGRVAELLAGASEHLQAGLWVPRSVRLLHEAVTLEPRRVDAWAAFAQAEADEALETAVPNGSAVASGKANGPGAWIRAAEASIRWAIRLSPKDPDLRDTAGWIYLTDAHEGLTGAAGPPARQAVKQFSAALRLAPGRAALWRSLGDAYRLIGGSLTLAGEGAAAEATSRNAASGSSPASAPGVAENSPGGPPAEIGTPAAGIPAGASAALRRSQATTAALAGTGQEPASPVAAPASANALHAPKAEAGKSASSTAAAAPAAGPTSPDDLAIRAYTNALRLDPRDAVLHLVIFHLMAAKSSDAKQIPALMRELDLAASGQADNSLFDYLRAQLLFRWAGSLDTAASAPVKWQALEWLFQGNSAPYLKWAPYVPDFPPLMATFINPLMGGSGQDQRTADFARLRALAREAAAYGDDFDANEQPDAAAQVWEAVMAMGSHVAGMGESTNGGMLAYSTGLAIDEIGLSPLARLVEALGTPEQQEMVAETQAQLRQLRAYLERELRTF